MNDIQKVAKSIKASVKEDKGTKPYDTQAKVVRIDGSTAWVQIPGGVDETPVRMTIDANKGDTVQVRVSGGRAWITGNATSPPTSDAKAIIAQYIADTAKNAAYMAALDAEAASLNADNAKKLALKSLVFTIETEYTETSIVFTAKLMRAGEYLELGDGTDYPGEDFFWYKKKPTGAEYLGYGITLTVLKSSINYGETVYCTWTQRESSNFIDNNGNVMITDQGDTLIFWTEE